MPHSTISGDVPVMKNFSGSNSLERVLQRLQMACSSPSGASLCRNFNALHARGVGEEVRQ
jgi:hypothetical protein